MKEFNKKSKKMREDEEDDEFKSWFYMFDDSDGMYSEYDTLVHTVNFPHIRYGWVIHTLRLSLTLNYKPKI